MVFQVLDGLTAPIRTVKVSSSGNPPTNAAKAEVGAVTRGNELLLMVQKSGVYQLSLVAFLPLFTRFVRRRRILVINSRKKHVLGGGFNFFEKNIPIPGEMIQFDLRIFFKWVETTN